MSNTTKTPLLRTSHSHVHDVLPLKADFIARYVATPASPTLPHRLGLSVLLRGRNRSRDRASFLQHGKIAGAYTSPRHQAQYRRTFITLGRRQVWHFGYSTKLIRNNQPRLSHHEPKTTPMNREVVTSSIRTYGDTIHTFVERHNYSGPFLPGYAKANNLFEVKSVGLKHVDHCVGNVALGDMNKWVKFYEDVMGFKLLITFDDTDISTEYTALMAEVVSINNTSIFPITEPAEENVRKSIILGLLRRRGRTNIAIARTRYPSVTN